MEVVSHGIFSVIYVRMTACRQNAKVCYGVRSTTPHECMQQAAVRVR